MGGESEVSAARNQENRHAGDRLLLFLLALICGGLHWYMLRSDPFLAHPIIDAAEYLGEARGIVAGVRPVGAPSIHGPVYPLLLAPLLGLFGDSLRAIYVFQIVLLASSALLVRSCGVKMLGRAHGNLAGAMLAAAPPMLYFQVQLLPVITQVFLHSLLLYLLVVRDVKKKGTPILAGMICGISWLTHPGCGPFVLLLFPALYGITRRSREIALLALGIAIALIPFSLLRVAAGENPLPVQGNSGLNMYIGNGEGADGTAHVRPGYAWEKLLAAPALDGVREGGENAWYLRRVYEEAVQHPVRFFTRLAAKGVLFVSGHPIDASHDFAYFRDRSPLLRNALLDAVLLIPLAVAFLIARRGGIGLFSIPAAALGGYWIGTIVTLFSIRYRAPVWPFLVILAAGVPFAWRGLPAKRVLLAIVPAALLLIVSLSDPFAYKGRNPVRTAFNLGRLFYTRGDFPAAEEWFQKARRNAPDDPDCYNALGVLAVARGDTDEAVRQYEQALRLAPDYADAHYNLGLILVRRGDLLEANQKLKEAVRLSPSHAAAHYTLGILRDREGDRPAAESEYRVALRCDPTRDDTWTALGVILASTGRVAEAESCFRKALDLNPASPSAGANLRRLLSSGGNRER